MVTTPERVVLIVALALPSNVVEPFTLPERVIVLAVVNLFAVSAEVGAAGKVTVCTPATVRCPLASTVKLGTLKDPP